jgi:hypothetical protein
MEDRVRKALRKVLKEFLDTSKSRVDMTKVTEAEMIAFEKAMSYAATFVEGQIGSMEKLAAESKIVEENNMIQPGRLIDFFEEE